MDEKYARPRLSVENRTMFKKKDSFMMNTKMLSIDVHIVKVNRTNCSKNSGNFFKYVV